MTSYKILHIPSGKYVNKFNDKNTWTSRYAVSSFLNKIAYFVITDDKILVATKGEYSTFSWSLNGLLVPLKNKKHEFEIVEVDDV